VKAPSLFLGAAGEEKLLQLTSTDAEVVGRPGICIKVVVMLVVMVVVVVVACVCLLTRPAGKQTLPLRLPRQSRRSSGRMVTRVWGASLLHVMFHTRRGHAPCMLSFPVVGQMGAKTAIILSVMTMHPGAN